MNDPNHEEAIQIDHGDHPEAESPLFRRKHASMSNIRGFKNKYRNKVKRKINPTYDYMEQIETYRNLGILFYLPEHVHVTGEDLNNFYWEDIVDKNREGLKLVKPHSMKSVRTTPFHTVF